MKNNLLLTTALVATAFVASNAMADEFIRNQNQLDNIDLELTDIAFNDTDGELNDMGTLILKDNLEINGQVTLHDKVTLTGDKTLTVNGYLTQTHSGSDISGTNVIINGNNSAGGLVLGNKLIIGDMTINDAKISLYQSTTPADGVVYADNPVKTLTIASGKTLTLNGNNTINHKSGGDNNQTLTIDGAGTVQNNGTLTGNIIFAEGSSYAFDINETATEGGKVNGTITLDGNVKLATDVSHITSANDSFEFATNVDGSGNWDTSSLTNTIYNVGVNKTKNALTFETKSSGEIASSIGADSNQAGTIAAVITGGETGNTTFDSLAKEITSLAQTNASAAIDAATALAPEVNPMVQQVQTSTLSQVFSAISSRMSGGSLASSGNGMSSGDNVFEKAAMWVKGLFNKSKLDTENGFDADSEGLAFGLEKIVKDDVKAGIAYAYTKTDVDGFMRTTDVDTHTLALYGEYKPSNWYVNGMMSYGWSDYSENKNVAGVNVNADYDAETFGLQAMAGYETEYKDYKVTPEAGLRYVHVKQDSYTDTAGQNISSDDLDVVTAVVGAKATRNWELENGTVLKPEVRAALTYDVIDADNSSVVTLANGSAYTVEGEGLDRLGFEFGAGISADVNEKIEITVGYEGKFREDYQDHTGMLNAKYKF